MAARPHGLHLLAAGIVLAGTIGCTAERHEVTVFAAASLTDAVQALADSFEVASEQMVRVNFAASSILARQIEGGARADVFMTADPAWGTYLVSKGLSVSGDTMRITTHLVLFEREREGGGATPAGRISGARRLAIGDPAYVPAGAYARAWLECMNLWEKATERMVPTVDVRAALAAVLAGAVDAAIVYASDVLAAGEALDGRVTSLDAACQPIIRYGVFVVARDDESVGGASFAAFVNAPEQRDTWERFGFEWR